MLHNKVPQVRFIPIPRTDVTLNYQGCRRSGVAQVSDILLDVGLLLKASVDSIEL